MKLTITAVILLLVGGVYCARAQNESHVCEVLSGYMAGLQKDGYGSGSDSMNNVIHRYLSDAAERHPEMLKMGLGCLDTTGLSVLTSDDKKFRMYVWDQYNGGTMHYYDGIVQYETAPGKTAGYSLLGIDTLEEGNSGNWYSGLRSVKTKSGKTVYLAFSYYSASGVDKSAGIEAYTISDGKLIAEYPFFYTKTKKFGEISYYYNLMESQDFGEEDFPEITLSNDNKTLTIPVVTQDGKMTKGKLVYVFDGEKFVFAPAKK